MALKRISNWEPALASYLIQASTRAFEWGVFDCGLAASGAILVMTGTDPAASYRGSYKNMRQAMDLIRRDLATFASGIATSLEMPVVPPTFARRGDLVLVDNNDPTNALSIVDLGGRFAACASTTGFKRVAMQNWLRAWRVG